MWTWLERLLHPPDPPPPVDQTDVLAYVQRREAAIRARTAQLRAQAAVWAQDGDEGDDGVAHE